MFLNWNTLIQTTNSSETLRQQKCRLVLYNLELQVLRPPVVSFYLYFSPLVPTRPWVSVCVLGTSGWPWVQSIATERPTISTGCPIRPRVVVSVCVRGPGSQCLRLPFKSLPSRQHWTDDGVGRCTRCLFCPHSMSYRRRRDGGDLECTFVENTGWDCSL